MWQLSISTICLHKIKEIMSYLIGFTSTQIENPKNNLRFASERSTLISSIKTTYQRRIRKSMIYHYNATDKEVWVIIWSKDYFFWIIYYPKTKIHKNSF